MVIVMFLQEKTRYFWESAGMYCTADGILNFHKL